MKEPETISEAFENLRIAFKELEQELIKAFKEDPILSHYIKIINKFTSNH